MKIRIVIEFNNNEKDRNSKIDMTVNRHEKYKNEISGHVGSMDENEQN
jgi:hypothetical protein